VNVLSVLNLSKSYGLNAVFKKISFSLNRGERAALLGPNGCGKSTLLSIIAGEEMPDAGKVAFTPVDLRVGYLHQGIQFDPNETVGGYLNRFAANLEEALCDLAEVCAALEVAPNNPPLLAGYERTLPD
jgi:ATPase subunit of ABC transporter with duplicated ATPase domains